MPQHRFTFRAMAAQHEIVVDALDAVAAGHAAQAAIHGAGVVGVEVLEVARGASHVERRAQAVAVVGAFEAAHPEGLEGRTAGALAGIVGHRRQR